MASNISLNGIDEVIDKLTLFTDTDAVNSALGEACALVERSARQKAPKGSGDLRRSITSEVKDLVGYVFTPLEYAPYVEFGTGLFAENGNGRQEVPWCYKDEEGKWHTTSGMYPHPFLRPALYENRKKILEKIKGGLTNNA